MACSVFGKFLFFMLTKLNQIVITSSRFLLRMKSILKFLFLFKIGGEIAPGSRLNIQFFANKFKGCAKDGGADSRQE